MIPAFRRLRGLVRWISCAYALAPAPALAQQPEPHQRQISKPDPVASSAFLGELASTVRAIADSLSKPASVVPDPAPGYDTLYAESATTAHFTTDVIAGVGAGFAVSLLLPQLRRVAPLKLTSSIKHDGGTIGIGGTF